MDRNGKKWRDEIRKRFNRGWNETFRERRGKIRHDRDQKKPIYCCFADRKAPPITTQRKVWIFTQSTKEQRRELQKDHASNRTGRTHKNLDRSVRSAKIVQVCVHTLPVTGIATCREFDPFTRTLIHSGSEPRAGRVNTVINHEGWPRSTANTGAMPTRSKRRILWKRHSLSASNTSASISNVNPFQRTASYPLLSPSRQTAQACNYDDQRRRVLNAVHQCFIDWEKRRSASDKCH